MNAQEIVKQLLTTGAVTVVTTSFGAPLGERTPLDAITVIQLDGDVVSYFREGAALERHFAALRQVRVRLRRLEICFRVTSRGAFWSALLGTQYLAYGWAVDTLVGRGLGALGEELLRPEHLLRAVSGVLSWFGLRALERLLPRVIKRALSVSSAEVWSARLAHARSR